MRSGEPPDEAYSRVTSPERFLPLHAAADALVAELVARCDVAREEVGSSPRSVRLVPAGGGAPVTLTWTDFPGVRVAAGDAVERSFPGCGCDACDWHGEDVDGEIGELQRLVASVVAGGFTELVAADGSSGFRLVHPDGGSESSTPPGRLTERHWPAWPPLA